MKVLVCAPVKNREKILQRYLDALFIQDFCGLQVDYYFVLNDSKDNSKDIIIKNSMSHPISFDEIDFENKENRRTHYSFGNLAVLRNYCLIHALELNYDYVFFVDTDIILNKGTFRNLYSKNRFAISALIANDSFTWSPLPERAFNIMKKDVAGNCYQHIRLEKKEKVIEVDITGACFLIKKAAFTGCFFGYHRQGEDIPFCEQIKQKGLEIFCDLEEECFHKMNL